MHKCARCGREAGSLEEINNGCACGSKIFIFNKGSSEENVQEHLEGEIVFPEKQGEPAEGKPPKSSFARAAFSSEDVENIKIVSEGVFFVNLNGLSKNPVVLKDENGIYYVKLPLPDQNGKSKKMQNDGSSQAEF